MDTARLPLSALLSQTLVAFTIECDNEAEHRQPHHTANHTANHAGGAEKTPWLMSLVMYMNCLKYIPDEGITAGRLHDLARTETNLGGMRRWGYITIDPKPLNLGGKGITRSSFLKTTRAGKPAREVWPGLITEIEERWATRFGIRAMEELRESLSAVVSHLDPELPDCMPIVHYGLACKGRCGGSPEIGDEGWTETASLSLYALLAKALVAFALAFETDAGVSLAISANVLRVIGEGGAPVRDIPVLAGVSKEAVAMAEGWLDKQGFIEIEGKGVSRYAHLTPKGQAAKRDYIDRVAEIERDWRDTLGEGEIERLRGSLEKLAGAGDEMSPLFPGVAPYPDGWRAKLRRPSTLPHFPMVLHRGGYPDGS